MAKVKYKNLLFRIILSSIASFVVMLFTLKWEEIPIALKMPYFYFCWFLSFCMTIGLVYVIHLVTLYLDRRYDWRINPKKRSLLQGLWGAIAPGLAETVMVAGYSMIVIDNFDLMEFIVKDTPWIFLFIVFVNMAYAVHFLILTAPKIVQHGKSEPSEKTDSLPEVTVEISEQKVSHSGYSHQPETLIYRYGSKVLYLNVAEDILYFQRLDKALLIATRERIINYGEKSILQMQETYGDLGFCQINRGVLINMRIVQGYDKIKRENHKIVFHNADSVPNAESADLYVKKLYFENFKQDLEVRTSLSKTVDVN